MDEIYNLYVRGDDSSFHPIPALKGDKGDNGENGKFYYTTVVLQSSLWSNSGSPYTQTLDVEHVTANSCVNICPSYTNIPQRVLHVLKDAESESMHKNSSTLSVDRVP